MGRKEFKRLTQKGREKLKDKIIDLQDKLVSIENDYEKIYDLEECINDNLNTLLECDADCSTCSLEDLKECHRHFRQANLFWLAKLKTYDEILLDYIEFLIKFSQDIFKIVSMSEEKEEEEEKAKPDEPTRFYT